MFNSIAKLIVALNGNLKKEQIAAGFSWGLLLAFVPGGTVFWIILFVVSFFFKHHHWSKLLVMALVKLFLGLLNPLLDSAGWEFLHIEALQPFFTSLYNMPFVPLTKFNNTLVAGGIAAGVVLWLPVFFLVWFLVPIYRNTLIPRLRESKVFKALWKLPFFSTLEKAVKSADLSAGI